MKKMRRALVFLGMGSCLSADHTSVIPHTSSLEALHLSPQKPIHIQPLLFTKTGTLLFGFFFYRVTDNHYPKYLLPCLDNQSEYPVLLDFRLGFIIHLNCFLLNKIREKGKAGSKEEVFFDSKAWLESDDEDFLSVNGDYSPEHKQTEKNGTDDYNPYEQNKNGEHKAGRRLSDLFRNSNSFSSDSRTSVKAGNGDQAMSSKDNYNEENKEITTPKLRSQGKTAGQRCLPSLVRTLSCGSDHKKKRLNSPARISVAA